MTIAMYKQCELTRPGRLGLMRDRIISWIPAELAHVGAIVRLRDCDECPWSEDWRVDDVTEPALPAHVVQKGSTRQDRMRQAVGV